MNVLFRNYLSYFGLITLQNVLFDMPLTPQLFRSRGAGDIQFGHSISRFWGYATLRVLLFGSAVLYRAMSWRSRDVTSALRLFHL